MTTATLKRIELSLDDLEAILDRSTQGPLTDEERDKTPNVGGFLSEEKSLGAGPYSTHRSATKCIQPNLTRRANFGADFLLDSFGDCQIRYTY